MINIDLERLIEIKLSPTEYIVLKLLFEKDYAQLDLLCISDMLDWTHGDTFLGIIGHLELRGWLKVTNYGDFTFRDVVLRQKANNLFEDGNNMYLKCFTIFPMKVPDGHGGYRVLRSKSSDSEDFKKGLKLWNDIMKKESADVVIKALERQLTLTRAKLQYTQNWLTWLRQKTYQKYVDLGEVDKQDNIEAI